MVSRTIATGAFECRIKEQFPTSTFFDDELIPLKSVSSTVRVISVDPSMSFILDSAAALLKEVASISRSFRLEHLLIQYANHVTEYV
jgi:hypothetical protein